jgi:predicted DNA-binding protein (MmcQ/YjbR family)
MALPETTEEFPWGDIAYKVKGKMFVVTGPGLPLRVTVKASPENAMTLLQHPAIEKAHYVGRYGWVTVTVTSRRTLDLTLALARESYDLVRAPKRRT